MDLFRCLLADEKAAVAESLVEVHYAAGDQILQQGDILVEIVPTPNGETKGDGRPQPGE